MSIFFLKNIARRNIRRSLLSRIQFGHIITSAVRYLQSFEHFVVFIGTYIYTCSKPGRDADFRMSSSLRFISQPHIILVTTKG